MPRQRPDHRAQVILSCVEQPEHAWESALYQIRQGRESPISMVTDAWEWYQDPGIRHLLDAMILSKGDDKTIAEALDLDPETLGPYRHLFFDRQVFRNAVEAMRYARDVECENELKDYYTIAIQQGPEFLAGRFRVGKRPDLDPRFVKRVVLSDQYERFLAQRGRPIVDEDGKVNTLVKEAMRYGEAAVNTAVAILDKGEGGSDTAIKQLQIVLTGARVTKSTEEAGIKIEDVVG